MEDLSQAISASTAADGPSDNPTLAWATTLRARTYQSALLYDQALDDLETALRAQPDYPWAIELQDEIKQVKRSLGVLDVRRQANSDLPAKTDALGFTPLVDLYSLLNSRETRFPLALAITAPWGAGKSSVMLQLKQRLRDSRTESGGGGEDGYQWYTVWLDAWKYEKSERLWASLAKAMYEQPQQEMNIFGRVWFRLWLELRRRGMRTVFVQGLLGAIASAAVVTTLILMDVKPWEWRTSGNLFDAIAGAIDAGSTKNIVASVGGLGALGGVFALLGRLLGVISDPFNRSIQRHVSQPKYEDQLGFTREADRDVSNLIQSLTKSKGRKLAIFVDDLDRCSGKHIVEIVEAVNQIFNASSNQAMDNPPPRECVFILGMDRKVVADNIANTYGKSPGYVEGAHAHDDLTHPTRLQETDEDFGVRFLSKIVQMSIAVPPPSGEGMRKLLDQITGTEPTQEEQRSPVADVLIERVAAEFRKTPGDPFEVRRTRISLEDRLEELSEDPLDSEDLPADPDISQTLRAIPSEQLEVVIQQAERIVMGERFTADSEGVKAAELVALDFLERNPRQLKRFDNAFRLQLHVANRTTGNGLDFSPAQLVTLAKWVAIRLRWPLLAEDLDSEEGLLLALEDYANAEQKPREISVPGCERWFKEKKLLEILKVDDPSERMSSLFSDPEASSFLLVA